jgi:hypothetical protein
MKFLQTSFLFYSLLTISFHILAQITPWEAASQMQKGINLGNTLEPPVEGGWNNPPAQEYYFDLYKQAGFTCVRIPVRWDEHTQDVSPYQIDETWLQRVEEVADWGLERDMFVIVNAHHDDWIKQNYSSATYRARFDSIWAQVSRRFKNKPYRLIFEILNEPYGLTKEQNDDLHDRVLSIIRKTNPTRIVIFQGNNWGGSDELIDAAVPDDAYVIGSFHTYDPYTFGLLGEGTWGSSSDIAVLNNKFLTVKNWSDSHNIPVLLGEFGAVRSCDYNSRMKHYKTYVELAQLYGFIYCAWDDGGDFRILIRAERKWDEVKDILLHSGPQSPKNPDLKIIKDTIIQVNWTNVVSDHDSIWIERRTSNGAYIRIASLKADTNSYLDPGLLPDKYYYYRIIAHYNSGEDLYAHPVRIFLPAYVPKTREPFLGMPSPVPGIVEAENYDVGGEGLTYHDADSINLTGEYRPDEGVDIYSRNGDGYHIGNAIPGEWYEYTLDVENQGNYRIDAYLATIQGGGTFTLKIGELESGVLVVPSSNSWLITTPVSDTMYLPAGEQIMRFSVIDPPVFNIDKFNFVFLDGTTLISGYPDKPFNIFINRNREISLNFNENIVVQRIQVYNINGSLMLSVLNPACNQAISTNDLPEGIYIIQATTNKGRIAEKFFLD